jgi:hypothetical protein
MNFMLRVYVYILPFDFISFMTPAPKQICWLNSAFSVTYVILNIKGTTSLLSVPGNYENVDIQHGKTRQ